MDNAVSEALFRHLFRQGERDCIAERKPVISNILFILLPAFYRFDK
jgi:hypothetical protein